LARRLRSSRRASANPTRTPRMNPQTIAIAMARGFRTISVDREALARADGSAAERRHAGAAVLARNASADRRTRERSAVDDRRGDRSVRRERHGDVTGAGRTVRLLARLHVDRPERR